MAGLAYLTKLRCYNIKIRQVAGSGQSQSPVSTSVLMIPFLSLVLNVEVLIFTPKCLLLLYMLSDVS